MGVRTGQQDLHRNWRVRASVFSLKNQSKMARANTGNQPVGSQRLTCKDRLPGFTLGLGCHSGPVSLSKRGYLLRMVTEDLQNVGGYLANREVDHFGGHVVVGG